MKIITLLIAIHVFTGCCVAQIYLAPFAGYQVDANNNPKFKQVNTGLQFDMKVKRTNRYELIFELQRNWAVPFHSGDSSFSANSSLPIYANAKKTIKPSSWSLAVGHRFSIFGIHTSNIFSFMLYGGMSYQRIGVSYDYDKDNFIILNPDQSINRLGLFLRAGVEYMHLLKNGRIFIQLTATSPPVTKKINYPLSFNLMAPLAFMRAMPYLLKRINMPVNNLKKLLLLCLPVLLITGCQKTYTRYYDDAEDPGLAIFSNTGNDILSCLVDGKAWRTISRETSGIFLGSGPNVSYEVKISRISTNPLKDTLEINWLGYLQSNTSATDYFILHLAVPPNFSFRDFSVLQGQRLNLDSTVNGFFTKGPYDYQNTSGGPKGNGSIYFHTASLDSIGPNTFSGKMSGVFEADFNSFKITRGRFDHEIVSAQVVF